MATLVLVVLAATSVVQATHGNVTHHGPVNRQTIITTHDDSTQETHFVPIAGFQNVTVTGRGAATVTISMTHSGGPGVLRVIDEFGTVLTPGEAHLEASETPTSMSYTFAADWSNRADCRSFAIEWRSQTGAPIDLEEVQGVITYAFDNTRGDRKFACQ